MPERTTLAALAAVLMLNCNGSALAASKAVSDAESSKNTVESSKGYEQKQGNITVRLEKVTVDRLYNLKGFLDRRYGQANPDKAAVRKLVQDMAEQGPLRLVRVFITYTGLGAGTTIRIDVTHPDFDRRISGHVAISDNWQRRLHHLSIEKGASGSELYALVPPDVTLDQLFPCTIRVTMTQADGQASVFVFANVRF